MRGIVAVPSARPPNRPPANSGETTTTSAAPNWMRKMNSAETPITKRPSLSERGLSVRLQPALMAIACLLMLSACSKPSAKPPIASLPLPPVSACKPLPTEPKGTPPSIRESRLIDLYLDCALRAARLLEGWPK